MGLTYIFGWMVYFNFVTAFNIDTKNPYIYTSAKDTYFGYSIAFNSNLRSIVVGAPFSNDTNDGDHPWGSVFQCKYSGLESKRVCTKLPRLGAIKFGGGINTHQMMGATVSSDNYRTMACAPRYKYQKSPEYTWLLGKCEIIYPKNVQSKDRAWNPCYKYVGVGAGEYGNCQAGFSAQFLASSDEQTSNIAGGCPTYTSVDKANSIELVKGLLAHYSEGGSTKFTNEALLNVSDYLGYAVGSGRFSTDDVQSIVGGAPRANLLMGRVLLYKITTAGFPLLRGISDPSERPGSYFGSSLAVTNIDNDANNLDDLVVGAPFYSSGQQPNEGAVYVYLNLEGGMQLKQKIYGDKERNACFGFSIGSVGDLNKDANNDIVIGAPWGGKDGKGVVYVYYGTPNVHKPLLLKQTLTPSLFGAAGASLNGFGFSFAEYYPYDTAGRLFNDVDRNKYPDLGIGAYKSDQVLILRSRPVVTILGTLAIEDEQQRDLKRIDLFDRVNAMCTAPDGKKYKCMRVKVSFTITGVNIGTEGTVIKYTVNADANQKASKRGFFMDDKKNKVHLYTGTMKVKDHKKSYTVTVFLANNTKDIVREMVVELNWKIDDSTSCATGKICPVANQLVYQLSIKKVPYIKGCSSDGNDVCNTDLQLKLTRVTEKISSGITEVLKVRATITNRGENAFLNKLQIVYPFGIQPNKVQIKDYPGTVIWDPNSSLDKQNIYTLEVMLSNPINKDQEEIVDIQFGVGSLTSSTKIVTLTGKVITESEEMNPADNTDDVSVNVVLVANLTITGNALPEMVRWSKDATSTKIRGQRIIHTFLLQNGGPSDVDDGLIVIDYPIKVNGHYILNMVDFEVESSKKSKEKLKCENIGKLNPVNLNDTGIVRAPLNLNGTKSRKRRGLDKPLFCDDTVECRRIRCPNISLKKSGDVSIKITSTLVEATFEKHIKENRKLIVKGKFTSLTVGKPDKDPAKDDVEVSLMVISPHETFKADSKPLEWWIILLCVLAALIIILGVVAILYKKGFFTRNRPQEDEQEKLKNGYEEEEEEE